MNLSNCKLKSLSFAAILGLTACGGGGSDTPATTTVTGSSSGIFLDAEVGGLSYTTSSGVSGTTDANGTYTYNTSDTITFNVGGVTLGSVPAAPSCTPLDFGAASTNIARFIQSLDADGIPGNGIDLSAAATSLAGVTVDSSSFALATFAPEILAAIGTANRTDIGEAAALANLAAGTRTTFSNADIDGKLFVVIVPSESDIGIVSFDTISSGAAVFSVVAGDTIAGGGNGFGTDETWVVGTDGVLTLTDVVNGAVATVNRIGGSTRSVSVTISEDGLAPLPLTLLVPQAVTASDLGGDGSIAPGKSYDVVYIDGSTFTATFNADLSYSSTLSDGTPDDNGTYEVGGNGPNVVTLTSIKFPGDFVFLIYLDGNINNVGETVSILIADATDIGGGTPTDPNLQFNSLGVGSATLKP